MALTLGLHLLKGFRVTSDVETLPVVVEIGSDEAIEVAEKVDVTAAWLDASNGSDLSYGFSASGRIGTYGEGIEIAPKRPKYLCIDVLEYEERKGSLEPGTYDLTVKVCVFVKREGEFKAQTLLASSELEVF